MHSCFPVIHTSGMSIISFDFLRTVCGEASFLFCDNSRAIYGFSIDAFGHLYPTGIKCT